MKQSYSLLCLYFGLLALTATTAHSAKRPNFVFLQGEAQGWTSMSIQLDRTIRRLTSSTRRTSSGWLKAE